MSNTLTSARNYILILVKKQKQKGEQSYTSFQIVEHPHAYSAHVQYKWQKLHLELTLVSQEATYLETAIIT